MAAARLMVSTTNIGASSSLLFKAAASPFFKPHHLSFCVNNTTKLVSKKRSFASSALYRPDFRIKEEGTPETLDYRVFFVDNSGKKISPWHDIPLRVGDGAFNFIVEIPKESSAKMEVATDEVYTPIKQDTKKGKLRYYPAHVFKKYGDGGGRTSTSGGMATLVLIWDLSTGEKAQTLKGHKMQVVFASLSN